MSIASVTGSQQASAYSAFALQPGDKFQFTQAVTYENPYARHSEDATISYPAGVTYEIYCFDKGFVRFHKERDRNLGSNWEGSYDLELIIPTTELEKASYVKIINPIGK